MLGPRRTLMTGQPQRASAIGVTGPNRGIVAKSAYNRVGDESSIEAALYLFNMIPGELGCRVRPGSREYATQILDKNDEPGDIRTLMYYNSTNQGGGDDRFFAVCDLGIYDITGGTVRITGDWLKTDTAPVVTGWRYNAGAVEISKLDANTTDYSADLLGIRIGSLFIMTAGEDGEEQYRATGLPTDQGGYISIPADVVPVPSVLSDPIPDGSLTAVSIEIAPELVLTWPSQTDDAGWCSFVNYTNVAGNHYLLVCDEANGYYIYDGTNWAQGAWQGGGGSNPPVEEMAAIMEHNGRIWMVQRNSATAWYLPVLEFDSTDPSPVNVGSRFISGGHLVQIASWTVDAGDGMNDKLVMISAAGDVLVWNGDPGFIPFVAEGRWQVGTVPEGRRVMSHHGGDILILTTNGVVRLSEVLAGLIVQDSQKYVTDNISAFVRDEMQHSVDEYGWSIDKTTRDGIMMISVPRTALEASKPPVQFVMDITTGAWAVFRGLDVRCMNEHDTEFYFGGSDGRVWWFNGTVDNAKLDGSSSEGIEFSFLTHYTALQSPAIWKQVQMVRPWWLGDADPAYFTKVFYDFSLSEIETSPIFQALGLALWDKALWDISEWAVDAQNYWETVGAKNMGRHIAFAVRGTTTVATTYLGCDLMVTQGGPL